MRKITVLSVLAILFFQLAYTQDTAFVTKGFYVTEDPYMIGCSEKQPDGKILISGSFTHYNGLPSTNIVRLNTDGSRDTSFDKTIGTDGDIMHILVQPDGKIIMQGVFQRYKQQSVASGLIRINTNGTLDNTFNAPLQVYGYNGVTAMAIQKDGKLVVAGFGLATDGYDREGIIRLNSNGTIDNSFAIGNAMNKNESINALTIDHNGNILTGGEFYSWNGKTVTGLIRLTSSGGEDVSFHPQKDGIKPAYGVNTSIWINVIQELADASILIGGNFSYYDSTIRIGFAKLHSNGSLDTSIKQDPSIPMSNNFTVQGIAMTTDGKLLLGGHFYFINNDYKDLVLLQASGMLDSQTPNFGPDPSYSFSAGGVSRIYVNADNSFITVGMYNGVYNGSFLNNIAYYNSPIHISSTFTNKFQRTGLVNKTVIQPDNKILVSGDFNKYDADGNQPMQRIARLQKNGVLDSSFQNTLLNGYVSDINLNTDNTIVAVGSFSAAGTVHRNGVARFHQDGSLDLTFDPGKGPDINNMYCVRSFASQYMYVGGSFTHFSDSAHQGIVRLLWNGSVDATFNTTRNLVPIYAPASIDITHDGKVLAAESSDKTIRDYNTPLRLYKLLNDGSFDNTFHTPSLGWSMGMKVREGKNGSIYWLGWLIQQSNPNHFQQTILRLKGDGTLDSTTNPLPSDYSISDFTILPDSNLVVTGQQINGFDSTYFVMRLKPDLSIDSTFIPVALYYNLKHVDYTSEGNIVIAGEPIRYFRFLSEQVQNVGLLKNSSMQISTTSGSITTVVKNMLDGVTYNQTINVGTSTVQNFTASNHSNLNLSLLDPNKIIVSGANASEFTVTLSSNKSVIVQNDSLPFKVTFKPTTAGAKTARITIPYSNGIDNKYTFIVAGNALDNITAVPTIPADNHGILVYPNPTIIGTVYIECKESIERYSIADATGKVVKNGLFSEPYNEYKKVPINGLKAGIYFISLKGRKIDEVVKVVVIR